MKTFLAVAGLLIIAAIAIGALLGAYVQKHAPEKIPDFWISIGSSLVVGLIVGLVVVGIQAWQTQSDEAAAAASASRAVQARLAELLKSELDADVTLINAMIATNSDDELLAKMFGAPIRHEFWDSVLATGDTKTIADLELLDLLSSAYRHVRRVASWQERVIDSWAGQGRGVSYPLAGGGSISGLGQVVQQGRTTLPEASDALSVAITALEVAYSDRD